MSRARYVCSLSIIPSASPDSLVDSPHHRSLGGNGQECRHTTRAERSEHHNRVSQCREAGRSISSEDQGKLPILACQHHPDKNPRPQHRALRPNDSNTYLPISPSLMEMPGSSRKQLHGTKGAGTGYRMVHRRCFYSRPLHRDIPRNNAPANGSQLLLLQQTWHTRYAE